MELNFGKNNILCLRGVVQEVRSSEQTQEIKLSDGMPDIGQILAAWGQVILRSKEWRGDCVSFSGGMMVWVLYAPEDGGAERCIDAWLPFQMKWDIPEDTPEGSIRIQCLPRFVDARPVSARKIMMRAGICAMVEAMVTDSIALFAPPEETEGVELLRSIYPVRLPREVGEKTFLQDEELILPDTAPMPEKLVYYHMEPRVSDRKVLADKVVFRGSNGVHVLYRSEEGKLHSWDFDVPFSQYADLNSEFEGDPQAEFWLSPTSLDMELDEEGHMRLKCGITAQYLITDKQPVTLIEDAYAPGRELDIQREDLELPAVLENRRENLYGEQTIHGDVEQTVDISFLADFPRQARTERGVELEVPGSVQILYYDGEGNLRAGTARWEGKHFLEAGEGCRITAIPRMGEAQVDAGNGGTIQVKAELPVEMTATVRQELPMVTGVKLGQQTPADPNRPSLILRRAGEKSLWDIAKESGSTVEAIRGANRLSGEPAPGQMLLIPVP